MPAVNRCSSSLARSSSPSSRIVSSTASAAAAAIGLPPKVEPCAPAVIRSAASPKARVAPIGQAAAERLGQGDDVGLEAVGLVHEPGAGAADAGLHLVDGEQRAGVPAAAAAAAR